MTTISQTNYSYDMYNTYNFSPFNSTNFLRKSFILFMLISAVHPKKMCSITFIACLLLCSTYLELTEYNAFEEQCAGYQVQVFEAPDRPIYWAELPPKVMSIQVIVATSTEQMLSHLKLK